MNTFALDDIQGNVLRGYRSANARHFAIQIPEAGDGRGFLAELLSATEPTVTPANTWDERPHYCLNVGLTWEGLKALGVAKEILASFPEAFAQGAAARASASDPDGIRGVGLGDVGESAPANWILGGPSTPPVHLMLSLFTDEHRHARRDALTKVLREAIVNHGLIEVSVHDAAALPNGTVHFGYRDGISQPRIAGAPGRQLEDMQPEARAGDFLLGGGFVNSYGGNHIGSLPAKLADNATYAAFRILAQDCAGFESLLDTWALRWNVDRESLAATRESLAATREWLAAKLMGRWRSGAPLTTNPETAEPAPAESELNRFDYGPSPEHPLFLDDEDGYRCPAGSHIRRLQPRSGAAAGMANTRRLIRRGMPYGPPYDPADPADGVERGLIGLFVCADLELQYEFVLRVWANQDSGAPGLRGTREPIVGDQPDHGGQFLIPVKDARRALVLSGLPTLTRTRGSVYCMMPGLGGLRYLSTPL